MRNGWDTVGLTFPPETQETHLGLQDSSLQTDHDFDFDFESFISWNVLERCTHETCAKTANRKQVQASNMYNCM